jgi:hypothetical protein
VSLRSFNEALHHLGAWGGHLLLTSALDGNELSDLRAVHFTPEDRQTGSHWKRGPIDPKAGLYVMEKISFVPAGNRTLIPQSAIS